MMLGSRNTSMVTDLKSMCAQITRARLLCNRQHRAKSRLADRLSIRPLSLQAHDFDRDDFVSDAKVIVGPVERELRSIYAQIGFLERLYVQGARGQFEFSVRRAFLSLDTAGGDKLRQSEMYPIG